MKKLLKKVVLFTFLSFSVQGYSQGSFQQLSTEEIANRIAYVHGGDYVLNNPTLVSAWGNVMTDRIEYQVLAQGQDEKYPLLSSMPLMSKSNPGIQGADFENFNVNTFNPLAYNLDFFSDKTQVLRIDNTDYIMVIHPIKRN